MKAYITKTISFDGDIDIVTKINDKEFREEDRQTAIQSLTQYQSFQIRDNAPTNDVEVAIDYILHRFY